MAFAPSRKFAVVEGGLRVCISDSLPSCATTFGVFSFHAPLKCRTPLFPNSRLHSEAAAICRCRNHKATSLRRERCAIEILRFRSQPLSCKKLAWIYGFSEPSASIRRNSEGLLSANTSKLQLRAQRKPLVNQLEKGCQSLSASSVPDVVGPENSVGGSLGGPLFEASNDAQLGAESELIGNSARASSWRVDASLGGTQAAARGPDNAPETVPGHTLLERGTRLIDTTPKESRWREAKPKKGVLDSKAIKEGDDPFSPGGSQSQNPLDVVFGYNEPGRGRSKSRFRRNPQPDVGSTDKRKAGVPSLSSGTIAQRPPREWQKKKDAGLHKYPSSGLLTGYESADDPGATHPASDWVVKTCPVCHGTATLVCNVCGSDWRGGTCPQCKGVGYVACTHCGGSGTIHGQTKRAQPKALPLGSPNGEIEGDEEGPSLMEAYRIIKSERQSESDGESGRVSRTRGQPKSEEHRRKISRALQGKPRAPMSIKLRMKLSHLRREFFAAPGARERWSEMTREIAKTRRVMHCSNCGSPGHSSRYCPEMGFVKVKDKPCPICGQTGHSPKGLCPKRSNASIAFRCKNCGEYGHDASSCTNSPKFEGRILCEICGLPGHRVRECPERPKELIIQRCSICGEPGHNKKKCPRQMEFAGGDRKRPEVSFIQKCSICGQPGHNKKRCPKRRTEG